MKIGTPLLGKRLAVRDYAPDDLTFSIEMWFDRENGRYLSDPEWGYVDERYQLALDEMQDCKDGYYFTVELRENGEPVGTCCAFPDKDGRVVDIGYCIHRSCWNRGYGTELVELLAGWLREQGAEAVTAEAAKENRASCALLEKCGFTVIRESSFKKYNMDVSFDSCIYQKTLK